MSNKTSFINVLYAHDRVLHSVTYHPSRVDHRIDTWTLVLPLFQKRCSCMKNQKVKTRNPHYTHDKKDHSAPIGMKSIWAKQYRMEESAKKRVPTFEALEPVGKRLKNTDMRLLLTSKPYPKSDANAQSQRPTICDFVCGGGSKFPRRVTVCHAHLGQTCYSLPCIL